MKLIRIALLAAVAVTACEGEWPPPMPVPPPADSPGARAASPDAGVGLPPSDPTPPAELETKSSALYYGDPYATQGIDQPKAMGTFTCSNLWWAGSLTFDVYGGFELVPLPPDPYDLGVRHFRAVFHGTTWSESGRVATTLDGSVEVKESGYRTLVNPAATCETCPQGSTPWPPFGPYFYAGNNAYPWNSPSGSMHLNNGQITVYPTDHGYGPRGWVIGQMTPVWPGWSCSTLYVLFQRADPAPGGSSGGTCGGLPC